jgi:hypothetical protein
MPHRLPEFDLPLTPAVYSITHDGVDVYCGDLAQEI